MLRWLKHDHDGDDGGVRGSRRWRPWLGLLGLSSSVLAALPIATAAVANGVPPQYLPIEARWCLSKPVCIELEVADESDEQRLGLMQRPALPPLRGMWFPFSRPQPLKFWMHRCIAPLDMLFIRDDTLIAIHEEVPICPSLPCPSYGADVDGDGRIDFADGVIELRAGEAKRLGLQVGDVVMIERLTPAR